MSILQFVRILWARRLLILAATLSCVLGGYIVTLVVPPRWEAHSRVMLSLIKPDPITGQVLSGPATRGYVATQTELITDYSVAGQVADQLGWLSDPALIQQYQRRPKSDVRDFRRWLAQIVIDRTQAKLLEGSNILEISYTGSTAEQAKLVADALRKAYIDASLNFRRDDANRNADWFDAQAKKAKAALDTAQTALSTYERANGIVMADDKTDLETARLRALSASGVPAAPAVVSAPMASPASIQLAQIDAQIAQLSQTLGPNHPELQQLRAQRATVAALAEQDRVAARAAASGGGGGGAAVDRAVAAQRTRVIAQADKLQALAQLQSEVQLRRDQFEKTSARAAELRQEGDAADAGLTPLGAAVTPKDPKFPNMPLIIGGSLCLGGGVGVLVALLIELLSRRVRGAEDLQGVIDAPLLAVIGPSANARRQRFPTMETLGLGRRVRANRQKAVRGRSW